jgi:hypothetical protein
MRRLTICLAAAAALALPASAAGAIKTYGGSINLGGKIGVHVDLQGGDPYQVTEMAFKKFPAQCSPGPNGLLQSGFSFSNTLVENKRFLVDDDLPGGDGHLYFKGEFSHQAKRLDGRVKATLNHVPPGDATCITAKRGYEAQRGGDYPNLKAKVAKAVRIP